MLHSKVNPYTITQSTTHKSQHSTPLLHYAIKSTGLKQIGKAVTRGSILPVTQIWLAVLRTIGCLIHATNCCPTPHPGVVRQHILFCNLFDVATACIYDVVV